MHLAIAIPYLLQAVNLATLSTKAHYERLADCEINKMGENMKADPILMIVAVAIAIALSAVAWLQPDNPPSRLEKTGRSEANTTAQPIRSAQARLPESIRKVNGQNKNGPVSVEMLNRYNAGTDMRSFVAYALQHREMGGYLYANQVLRECHGVRIGTDIGGTALPTYSAGEDSTNFLNRTRAASAIQRRCADFLPEEIGNQRTSDLWEKGKKIDPLVGSSDRHTLAFSESMKNPESQAARKAALEDILKTGDPLVIDTLGLRLAIGSKNGNRGYFIDGRFHDLNSDVDIGLALSLLP